ncbi:hypothetical protein IFR05_012549 [Cadophora sp. M221]|nr:hypothetical protein IFR05_012549 [Cadophora sp. M221]
MQYTELRKFQQRQVGRDDAFKTKQIRVLLSRLAPNVNPAILQPRDSNIQLLDQLSGSKATPLAFLGCSDVPREFEYSESEIKILKVIGSGHHSVVYHIAAGGRTFALKVVTSTNTGMRPYRNPGIPKPNIFFESEHDAYTRLSYPNGSTPASTPNYFGYMRFTKPPQVNGPGSLPRKLFKSTTYRPAVYTDFLMDGGGHNESMQNDTWKDYFLNKPGNYILRGLVLDEIVAARHICDNDASNPDIARSGREGLEALHERGVLHGDVRNLLNAMFATLEYRVIWMDFTRVKSQQNLALLDLQREHLKKSATGTVASRPKLENHEHESVVVSGLTVVVMRRKNTAHDCVGKWPEERAPAVDGTKAKAAKVHGGK